MARIGLLEEEQNAPQDLYVTLSMECGFETVVANDDLSEGVDQEDSIYGGRCLL